VKILEIYKTPFGNNPTKNIPGAAYVEVSAQRPKYSKTKFKELEVRNSQKLEKEMNKRFPLENNRGWEWVTTWYTPESEFYVFLPIKNFEAIK
jgi:hypothetical protein